MPTDRWITPVSAQDRTAGTNASYTSVMAPLRDPYALDGAHFQIPLARLRRMDPQQRLAVNLTEELFARSATGRPAPTEYRTATIIGVSSSDYRSVTSAAVLARMLVDGSLGPEDSELLRLVSDIGKNAVQPMTGHSIPGVLSNMVPACVQSVFDLKGPAFSIDSACASSVSALDIACNFLRAGHVDACVTGGVYVALTPEAHIGFSAIGALSRSGVCRPFTAAADGFVIGEGGGLLLLKRLEDAERDGDNILAVIEAIGASNDGRASGVMTPTSEGQVAAVRDALSALDEQTLDVDAVEGHGTGTIIGDNVELETLATVCGPRSGNSIQLGSAKALIGHTMAASGALSVIKVLLSFADGRWFPQPSAPAEGWSSLLSTGPLDVPTSRANCGTVSRVAVNSFGFGGTNCHVILSTPEAVHCNA